MSRTAGNAGLFFEETGRTLLCSDLFFQPGDPDPLNESDILERASAAIAGGVASPLAKDVPYAPWTDSTLRKLADLQPAALAVMHGSSYRGDCRQAILGIAEAYKKTLAGLIDG